MKEPTVEEKCRAEGKALPKSFRTVMVDLNGVLDEYDGWRGKFEYFPPRDGVHEFLQTLLDTGWTLVLHTALPLDMAEEWLNTYDLMKYFDHITDKKEPALIYLDDRAVLFRGDFEQAIKDIEAFRVWWAKDGQSG